MMNMMDGSHNGWMMGGMGFFPILFWLLIIVGIFFVFKSITGSKTNESALDILNKRYAKGEIDNETYQRMKKEINGDKA